MPKLASVDKQSLLQYFVILILLRDAWWVNSLAFVSFRFPPGHFSFVSIYHELSTSESLFYIQFDSHQIKSGGISKSAFALPEWSKKTEAATLLSLPLFLLLHLTYYIQLETETTSE